MLKNSFSGKTAMREDWQDQRSGKEDAVAAKKRRSGNICVTRKEDEAYLQPFTKESRNTLKAQLEIHFAAVQNTSQSQ